MVEISDSGRVSAIRSSRSTSNKGPWTVKKCFMDQCMFCVNYQIDEKVDEEEWTEAKQSSAAVA